MRWVPGFSQHFHLVKAIICLLANLIYNLFLVEFLRGCLRQVFVMFELYLGSYLLDHLTCHFALFRFDAFVSVSLQLVHFAHYFRKQAEIFVHAWLETLLSLQVGAQLARLHYLRYSLSLLNLVVLPPSHILVRLFVNFHRSNVLRLLVWCHERGILFVLVLFWNSELYNLFVLCLRNRIESGMIVQLCIIR